MYNSDVTFLICFLFIVQCCNYYHFFRRLSKPQFLSVSVVILKLKSKIRLWIISNHFTVFHAYQLRLILYGKRVYLILIYTTQVNYAFHARWLVSSEIIGKYYSLARSRRDKTLRQEFNFRLIFRYIVRNKLIFLVTEWYIIKLLFILVSVKVVDIYLFTSTLVNNY